MKQQQAHHASLMAPPCQDPPSAGPAALPRFDRNCRRMLEAVMRDRCKTPLAEGHKVRGIAALRCRLPRGQVGHTKEHYWQDCP